MANADALGEQQPLMRRESTTASESTRGCLDAGSSTPIGEWTENTPFSIWITSFCCCLTPAQQRCLLSPEKLPVYALLTLISAIILIFHKRADTLAPILLILIAIFIFLMFILSDHEISTIKYHMATKDDIRNMATKDDIKTLTKCVRLLLEKKGISVDSDVEQQQGAVIAAKNPADSNNGTNLPVMPAPSTSNTATALSGY